ncbi:MAG TPA: phosphotransferase [Alphaproteobacteria bacterium]|nr:phosphotransferase [Alphaproteobacteria bacterium]
MSQPPEDLVEVLRRLGIVPPGAAPRLTALAGGVSSDIWRVELESGPVCVKRALPRLKVAADWQAPIERNSYEVAWFEAAGRIVPEAVPRILRHDPAAGLFVMEYLAPADYALWKEELRQGRADPTIARAVGERLVRIHAGTAGRADIARRFETDAIFHALRLEPYLEHSARAHPDRAEALMALVRVTAATKRTLVHGDISPKNILVGPRGPVFLDAECAWYGDPAFDLAFCLNHLLLKCLWTPRAAAGFLDCFAALAAAYRAGIDWEPAAELEARAARLLPGLLLARVDGKSPVEYVTEERDKAHVRRAARALLARPVATLAEVGRAWKDEIAFGTPQ